MQTILLFESGKRVDAIVLAVGADSMRVIVPGEKDTLELRRTAGQWCTGDGDAVLVEMVMPLNFDAFDHAHRSHAA